MEIVALQIKLRQFSTKYVCGEWCLNMMWLIFLKRWEPISDSTCHVSKCKVTAFVCFAYGDCKQYGLCFFWVGCKLSLPIVTSQSHLNWHPVILSQNGFYQWHFDGFYDVLYCNVSFWWCSVCGTAQHVSQQKGYTFDCSVLYTYFAKQFIWISSMCIAGLVMWARERARTIIGGCGTCVTQRCGCGASCHCGSGWFQQKDLLSDDDKGGVWSHRVQQRNVRWHL